MPINGKRPPLYEGMILFMADGGSRKILSFEKGAAGLVKYQTRKGRTGRFSPRVETVKRRDFWKGVEYVKQPKAA